MEGSTQQEKKNCAQAGAPVNATGGGALVVYLGQLAHTRIVLPLLSILSLPAPRIAGLPRERRRQLGVVHVHSKDDFSYTAHVLPCPQ